MDQSDSGAILAQVQMLLRGGRIAEAVKLLTQAMEGGNAGAAYTLGYWRMTGDLIRRDLADSRSLFGRASDLGLAEAEPIYVALLANGAGAGDRRWRDALTRLRERSGADPLAARQFALLDLMALTDNGDPSAACASERICQSPEVTRFPAFLTPAECAYLIERANPLLQPSVIVHPTTGAQIRDPVRTSSAAVFSLMLEDPVVHAVNRRIAAATGTRYEQGEPVQVLAYEPGEQYKLHSDALPPGHSQRILTFLVYLNEAYEGGETSFPAGRIDFRGRSGDGLMFRNVGPSGAPDPAARHEGKAVRSGRKLLLSKWIRAAPLDLSGPPGRPC